MAASIRAVGTAVFGTAATLAPGVPTQAAGDILLCFVGSDANASVTPTHSIDGSWLLIDTGVIASGVIRSRTSVYWLRGAGAESAPTVTFTPTGATACHHSAVIISVQSAIASGTPYEGASNNAAAAASAIALTLTTSTDNTLGFLAAMHADNVATAVTDSNSYTSRVATDNATGIDGFLAVRDKSLGAAGSGQGATVTFTGGGTSVGISGVAFAILPAVGGPTELNHFRRMRT